MTSKYALYVNSNNRDSGGGNTNESFTITDTSNRFSVPPRSVKLTSACIPYTWQNVTTGNNQFTLTEAGPGITITIPPGNYSGASLATAVATALNTSGATNTYTVTFSSATQKFTISATGNFTLTFSLSSTIAKRLGFTAGTTTPSGTSVTSTSVAILADDNEIFVCCNLVEGIDNGYDILVSGAAANSQILAVVPINSTPQGNTIVYTAQDDDPFFPITQSEWGKIYSAGDTTARSIAFFLQLPSGDTVNLQSLAWSAVLVFTR
jgi:hypothetical protein